MVIRLIRNHRLFFLGTAFAALALRLFFFIYFPTITDDSRVYADFATNWLQHGIYGQTELGQIVATDTRLPGYPAFLAAIFWVFGVGNFKAVFLAQILIDLGTCLIIADLARRMISDPAARIAFLLAALCPFLANYSAAALTETLEIFFTALALDWAVSALSLNRDDEVIRRTRFVDPVYPRWAAAGLAIAMCILLRPDGGILLAAVILYLFATSWRVASSRKDIVHLVVASTIVVLFALLPLTPWTIRNYRTLHHFQPLAPRYATESDEYSSQGFNRWVRTWIANYASVEEIYWTVPDDTIDADKLPSRAFDTAAEKDATLAVIADYNETQEMTTGIDNRFASIAADRVRAHPLRYYVELPVLRIVDMWLRPRTEILPPDVRWWEFQDDVKESAIAIGFGLVNLALVAMALLALIRRREIRWVGLLICFVVLRSAFLGTLENPEPRYTLECYPAVIVLAVATIARRSGKEERSV